MIPATEALQRLKEGNHRFVTGQGGAKLPHGPADFAELCEGQTPFAVILGCSDSRVPVELVFDQGMGDLFVVRVAGNIPFDSQIGSIEYAVQVLGARLVVVLGHSQCGAVQATLSALRFPNPAGGGKIPILVEKIRPSLEPLIRGQKADDNDNLLQDAVRAKIDGSLSILETESQILAELLKKRELTVIGAEYDLGSGKVDFWEKR